MKKFLVALSLFLSLFCFANTNIFVMGPTTNRVTLAWCPSPDTNAVGYKIYIGSGYISNWIPSIYSRTNEVPCPPVLLQPGTNWLQNYFTNFDVGNSLTGRLKGFIAGTNYFFAATAYDSNRVESEFSNEIQYSVPTNAIPSPPEDFRFFVP